MLVLSLIALMAGVIALIVGIVALVKASDLTDDLKAYKSSVDEVSQTVFKKVDDLAKKMGPQKKEKTTSALPVGIQRPEKPHAPAPKMQIVKKPATGPIAHEHPSPVPPPSSPPPSRPAAPRTRPPPKIEEAGYINFDCPGCGQNIDAPHVLGGSEIECPTCNQTIEVPVKEPTAPRPVYREASVPSPSAAGAKAESGAEGAPAGEGLPAEAGADDVDKGQTVRIDVQKFFEELDRPKRQVIIKRRQAE